MYYILEKLKILTAKQRVSVIIRIFNFVNEYLYDPPDWLHGLTDLFEFLWISLDYWFSLCCQLFLIKFQFGLMLQIMLTFSLLLGIGFASIIYHTLTLIIVVTGR